MEASRRMLKQLPGWVVQRRYYIGVAVGVVTIVALVMALSTSDDVGDCPFETQAPSVEALLKQKRNIATADKRSLANMVGYLHMYDHGYIPLVLTELAFTGERVVFTTECGSMSWKYLEQPPGNTRLYDLKFKMLDGLEIPKGNSTMGRCVFNYNPDFTFPAKNRYSCLEKHNSACIARQPDKVGQIKPVVDFVLESFEFELMGNPDVLAEGHFERPPESSSCDLW